MRTDGELIERDELRRLVDAALEIVELLQFRPLGADESQYHHLPLRHEPKGLKTTGARGVVFQQETVMRQLVEQPLGDGIVAAFAVPHTVLVAAAEMNGCRDVAEVLHHLRFCL